MPEHRVLITGACGFLGQAVLERLLAGGTEVTGVDIKPRSADPPASYEHVIDDLSDVKRLTALLARTRPTHIVHAGGVSGPMVLSDQPMATLRINAGGTLNLLEAVLENGVETFIHASSLSAVGNYYEPRPIAADYPLRPGSPYGASKAASEMLLRGLYGRVPLDLCALRFTSIYGPGRQSSLITDAIVDAGLAERRAEVEHAGDWPYIYIDDAADATFAACFSKTRRELVYAIAYPEQVSVSDLAAAAAKAIGIAHIPVVMSGPQFQRGPVDIEPARRDFGFAPRIDHREGMRRLVEARRGRA